MWRESSDKPAEAAAFVDWLRSSFDHAEPSQAEALARKWPQAASRSRLHGPSAIRTPPSASWLNIVEGSFRNITTERLRQDLLTRVPELVRAIDEYVAHHNKEPKPRIWTKGTRDILQEVIRANRFGSKQNAAQR